MNQEIYNLFPAQPFGRGTTDDTINSFPCAVANCAISSGDDDLAVGSKQGTFNDGDMVLIIQMRDNGDVDNWELNWIVSGASTSTFALMNPVSRDYTTQTGSTSAKRAQVVQVKESRIGTIGTFSVPGWRADENYNNHGWGGVCAMAFSELCEITDILDNNGKNGWRTSQDHSADPTANYYEDSRVVGGGFRGGWNSTDAGEASAGEGYTGGFVVEQDSRIANAGGGARNVGGGGGGHKNDGGSGDNPGGLAVGNDSLSRAWLGGGGGGGHDQGAQAPSGGGGAGLWFIWARRFKFSGSGSLQAKGGNGATGTGGGPRPSGGGAGGGIRLSCEIIEPGTGKILVTGGTKGGSGAGDGSIGRVRLNYGAKIIGGDVSAFSVNQDKRLISNKGAFLGLL